MTLLRFAAAFLLLLAFPCSPVLAESGNERPKIGLALSGGGARGGAHVGILKALEELDIPIDYIAGTSMGAIVGGLYAAGYDAAGIETILKEIDWTQAMSDQPARRDRAMRKKELEAEFLIPFRVGFNRGGVQLPLGLIEGQHLDQVFHELLMPVMHVKQFDQLPIPFRAVATDLVTGEEFVLSQGSLPDSLRASMSVPGVFAPVRIGDRLLVDGGMSNNLPVSVVREMGADIVIAVDISSPLLTEDQLKSIVSVSEQLTNFLVRRTTDAQIATLSSGDFLVVPALGNFSAANFEEAIAIVPLGYEATMEFEARLAALTSTSGAEHQRRMVPSPPEYIVEFLEINNQSVLDDRIIQSRLAVETGQPLDLKALDQSLDRIYSLDLFKSVTYDLVQNEAGQNGILINAVPRPWGPNYLQFGLELSSDFSGNSEFKLGTAYTRNALNSLGGELRVIGTIGREDEISFDFYQPIDTAARWFVEPQLYWRREHWNWWDGDERLTQFEISGWGAQFGIGRNFSTTDRLRLDYQIARADADLISGSIEDFDDEADIGELKLEYLHDSLNSLWFPTEGMFHRLTYLYAAETLGASDDYDQALANGSLVYSRGKNNVLLNYEGGYSFDDAAPVERWFRLGGFGRLSGLFPDQLAGRHAALMTLAYYRRMNDVDFIPAYAGMTLEAGNVWDMRSQIGFDDLRYSGSLFVGAETPLGPVYFAWGISDNGDNTAYFYIGNPFRVSRFD